MLRVAINGFGRIGRSILRALYETGRNQRIQIVAINELAEPEGIAHLLKYDTTHGRFAYSVELNDGGLNVAGDDIALLHCDDLEKLPWKALQVDLVLECTGVNNTRASGEQHLKQGAAKVLFSQPCQADMDSCTTNCIVPVIKAIDDAFGVESGTITTIHSSMHDQQVIDAYNTNLRLTRAASQSIIPVDTKLAVGIERIMPKFAGKFEAIAVRVPTVNVTAMDLSVTTRESVSITDVNDAIKQAQHGRLAGILGYTEEHLVSVDFNHDPHSCIVDGTQTRVSHKQLVKTLVWCDNEWGFANRMLDTALAMAQ